jgi:hypothetical protein
MGKVKTKAGLIKRLFKGTIDKVQTLAEDKRTTIIEKTEAASATAIIVKWLLTNKLTVALVILVMVMASRYSYLEYQYLIEKNKSLIAERDKYLERTKELKIKIDLFEKTVTDSWKDSKKTATLVEKMDSNEKKKLMLDLVKRLLLQRSGKNV